MKEKLRIFRKIIICSTNEGATRVSYVSVLISITETRPLKNVDRENANK